MTTFLAIGIVLPSWAISVWEIVMERRKLVFDAHDDKERSEIKNILSKLPEDHPAWAAHREGRDAIKLTYLVDGRRDLIDKLTQAWLDGYGRMLPRSGNTGHSGVKR
jgi:hypothetical protein